MMVLKADKQMCKHMNDGKILRKKHAHKIQN